MGPTLSFETPAAFRQWLCENAETSQGAWLLFGKAGGPRTLKAAEALEEALCFGWIDGQLQSIDRVSYRKYFSPRRMKSKWSEKNKALAARLEQQGRMTALGREKVREAQQNGQWDAPRPPDVTEADIAALATLLQGHEPAYTHFMAMPPSVQRTYTRAYADAKTEAGRAKRLAWMIGRLDRNLKPM